MPRDEQFYFLRSITIEGHFLLSSGYHSDRYLDKMSILQDPQKTKKIASDLVWLMPFGNGIPTKVVGPSSGGMILAYAVAQELGATAAYAERKPKTNERYFRPGTVILPDDIILIVDDIFTTGKALEETVAALSGMGSRIVGMHVIVDRSGIDNYSIDNIPLRSKAKTTLSKWRPDDCPLCKAENPLPLVKLGSTP